MSSLPQELPHRLRDIAHAQVVTAYNICLVLEKSLQQAIERGEDSGNSLMYVRILGYLIHYVPTEQGLKTVAEEITSSSNDSDLLQLGKMYFDHYIRACTFPRLPSMNLTRSFSQSQQGPHAKALQP